MARKTDAITSFRLFIGWQNTEPKTKKVNVHIMSHN